MAHLNPAACLDRLRSALRDFWPGLSLRGLLPIGGGSLNAAYRLDSDRGPFFVKWNSEAQPDLLVREAEGLRALAAAGTRLKIPKVILVLPAVGDVPAALVVEYLEPRPAQPSDWDELGRGLAELHRNSARGFGFDRPNYCGLTAQDNTWAESWPDFYATRRLSPLWGLCDRRRGWAPADRAAFAELTSKLPKLLGHGPAPSLIHGDLWSGNFLACPQGPALVDPAAHYADREMEWAMMLLFGGFPEPVLAAYQESWPLAAGWRERLPLHQLYHLLNHYLLFGGGYGEQAAAIVRRFA